MKNSFYIFSTRYHNNNHFCFHSISTKFPRYFCSIEQLAPTTVCDSGGVLFRSTKILLRYFVVHRRYCDCSMHYTVRHWSVVRNIRATRLRIVSNLQVINKEKVAILIFNFIWNIFVDKWSKRIILRYFCSYRMNRAFDQTLLQACALEEKTIIVCQRIIEAVYIHKRALESVYNGHFSCYNVWKKYLTINLSVVCRSYREKLDIFFSKSRN